MLQRQAEGIATAKANGVHKERKPLAYPVNWSEVYNLWKADAIKAVVAQRRLRLKPASFYRMVHKYEARARMLNANLEAA